MKTDTDIFGIKIKLQDAVSASNESDVGLFDDADNGIYKTFRWINADISSYSPVYSWKTGIISLEGTSAINEAMPNPLEGGNLATLDGATVSVLNSLSIGGTVSPFDKYLNDNEIYLYDLLCEVHYFQISGGSLLDPYGTVIFRGVIDSVHSSTTSLVLDLSSPYVNRSVNIGSEINTKTADNPPSENINKKINATMGTEYLEYDSNGALTWGGAAIAEKTEEKSNIFRIGNGLQMASDIFMYPLYAYDIGLENFYPEFTVSPAHQKISGCTLYFGLGSFDWKDGLGNLLTSGTHFLTELYGGIFEIISGTGSGQAAVIKRAYISPAIATNKAFIEFDNFFLTEPYGNDYTTPTSDDAWVKITLQENKFVIDKWPLKSLIDNDINELSSNFKVYSYGKKSKIDTTTNEITDGGNEFLNIPSNNITTNSDNNELIVGSQALNKNIITSENYTYVLPALVDYYTPDWKNNISTDAPNYSTFADRFGLPWLKTTSARYLGYGHFETTTNTSTYIEVLGNQSLGNMLDGDGSTSYSYKIHIPANSTASNTYLCLALKLPDVLDQTEANLSLNLEVSTSNASATFRTFVRTIRYVGNAVESIDKTLNSVSDSWNGVVNTFPDSYYSSNPTDDFDFYFYNNAENYNYDSKRTSSGVNLYELTSISGDSNYRGYNYAYLFINPGASLAASGSNGYIQVDIKNLAFAFKKSNNIKKSVYVPVKGRIFDSTWSSRKTSEDLIENPVDMIEHFKRLGNWQEVLATNIFGEEYASGALIGVGSFDSNELDHVRTARPSFQISDSLNNIVKHLCHDYWLNSFIDLSTGEEKLLPIMRKSLTAPTTTFTYEDFIGPLKKGTVVDTKYVYPNITVKYAYNNASKDYDKQLSITKANQSTFDASYVVGLSGSQAELFWSMSKLLFKVVKKEEDPPTYMQELRTVSRIEDAIDYVSNWYKTMGIADTDGSPSGLEFDPKEIYIGILSLVDTLTLHRGDHINVQLDHQTGDIVIECEVLSIIKNLIAGTSSVRLLSLGYQDSINYFVQEVTSTTDPNWNETTENQATHGEGADITEEM